MTAIFEAGGTSSLRPIIFDITIRSILFFLTGAVAFLGEAHRAKRTHSSYGKVGKLSKPRHPGS